GRSLRRGAHPRHARLPAGNRGRTALAARPRRLLRGARPPAGHRTGPCSSGWHCSSGWYCSSRRPSSRRPWPDRVRAGQPARCPARPEGRHSGIPRERGPSVKRTNRLRGPAVAVLAAAALTVAACSSSSSGTGASPSTGSSTGASASSGAALTASAPGITATTITIGSHQPLTGPAAPGYSEIAPASNAYFSYVNANGGVNGRKIVYKYLDDGYNPTNTASVVRQLVLQDNVYAIFNGLGTPTHLAVQSFLNAQKVPDVFVASGCDCWDAPSASPETFGWQLDYIREGKILGQYVAKHFAGKKIAYFYQDDEFGMDGVKGLDYEIPKSMVVSRQ